MNYQFYLEKLNDSKVFIEFMKKNPESYVCTGFFTIDLEGKSNQSHIDVYIPSKKEVVSFDLSDSVSVIPIESKFGRDIQQNFSVPGKLSGEIDFNFDDVQEIISEEIENRKIKGKIQKIMISLQESKGKSFLICTVFLSMLGLLTVHIDIGDSKPEIILFEKKSLFDLMKRTK